MKRNEDKVIFDWLGKNLTGQGIFIDIGARKGFWYRNLWKLFPSTEAHLFEPTPNIVEYSKKNHKNKKSIHIHKYALSDKIGTTEFNIDLKRGGWSGLKKQGKSNYEVIEVNVSTLDYFNFSNVEFIKIDVEGNELYTLKGALKTIKENHPVIYFECAYLHTAHYNYHPSDVYNLLANEGYKIFDLDLKELSLEEFISRTNREVPYTTSFYGNFIAQ
jgi:FkbM family methyltransferase